MSLLSVVLPVYPSGSWVWSRACARKMIFKVWSLLLRQVLSLYHLSNPISNQNHLEKINSSEFSFHSAEENLGKFL